jgi:Ca-activated chloride channel family protein
VIRPLAVAAVAGALLCSGVVRAQAPSPSPSPSPAPSPSIRPFTLEVDVDVVSVTAVVHDKAGRFVRGLGPGDIEVYEDGVRQDVSYFREVSGPAAEKIPLSVVLVLDASGSMRNNMHFLQEAAITLVHRLEDVDSALVVDFNEGVRGSADFTGDTDRLEQFVEALQAWGGTALYDAIHYGLNHVKDQPGRKAVIVFSDGADNRSSMKEEELLDYARSVEATVYCVGIRGESGLLARSPRGFMRKLAKETGGNFFFPDRVGDLIKVFAGISDELHNHYLLAYTPKRAPDSSWRGIDVRLKKSDAEIRVRKGYFAVKRRRPGPAAVPIGSN